MSLSDRLFSVCVFPNIKITKHFWKHITIWVC